MITLVACKNETLEADKDKTTIVKELNTGRHENVISILENKEQLTQRERFYLASAYAIESGIDIYSIYPLMEIELFHKEALDWDQLKDQKNPYKKFLKEAPKSTSSDEKKQEAWLDYLSDYNRIHKVRKSFDCQRFTSLFIQYCEQRLAIFEQKVIQRIFAPEDDQIDIARTMSYIDYENEVYDLIYNQQVSQWGFTLDEFNEATNSQYLTNENDYEPDIPYTNYFGFESVQTFYNMFNSIETELEDHVFHVLKLYYSKIRILDENTSSNNTSIEMMNYLWNLYESIPIIQRLPVLSFKEQDSVTKTLDFLLESIKINNQDEKSIKLMIMSFTLSMSSMFADSFNLEAVTNPMEIGCHLKPEVAQTYLYLIDERIDFLDRLTEIYNTEDENVQAMVNDFRANIENFKTVKSFNAQQFQESTTVNKLKNCDPTIYLYK